MPGSIELLNDIRSIPLVFKQTLLLLHVNCKYIYLPIHAMQAISAQRTGLPVQRRDIVNKRCRSFKLVVASTAPNKDLDRNEHVSNAVKKSAGAMIGAMAAASLVGGFLILNV